MRNSQTGRFDLIVLDIMMPGEDGLSVCAAAERAGGPPILMLTALADDTDRIVGLEIGADDYLAKPFNPRELLARVKAILRRSERTEVARGAARRTQARLRRLDARHRHPRAGPSDRRRARSR